MKTVAIGFGLALLLGSSALAQATDLPSDNCPGGDAKQCSNSRDFAGLGFGVGLSVTFDTGGAERISSAELVNGVVRVSDEDDSRARVMLESHFFFRPNCSLINVAEGNCGVGPFVAIQPGTSEIVEAAALGIMVGFREPNSANGFNIGIGIAVDPNTRTLGDGIVRDRALPTGETAVRYKEESQYGVVLLFSQSF